MSHRSASEEDSAIPISDRKSVVTGTEFEAQYEAFKKTIPNTVEIIDGGMVTTKEQSMEAGDKFRAADVDIVFLQMLTCAALHQSSISA